MSILPRSCAALALSLVGCASYHVETTELAVAGASPLRAIAVAPFDNLTSTASADEAVRAAIVNELRKAGRLRVVEIEDAPVGVSERWTASKLGSKLAVDAVLVGTVTAYEYDASIQRGGNNLQPSIGVTMRLVASSSGELLWAGAIDAHLLPLLSDDAVPLEQLLQDIAERTVDELDELPTAP